MNVVVLSGAPGAGKSSLVARGRCRAALKPDADFVDIVLETDGRALDELVAELLGELGWIS